MIAALVIAASGFGTISAASAQSCQELWVERNSYYKEAGYCFKTSRAISYFGNGGCIYDIEAQVPLPREIRARIAEITRIERRMGCN
ncbi:YARHG domain-containing protein [Bradyrhizobium sediminis]|uniref:YARHG domain-containing protein n=2 Tax=Bradyrhizobium sediminis TaxID=2840469 RepID=A0A975NU77_9BRAD|nr:YARHG domain-containing protein [Bradyrhizobium sediminis]QWG20801.1 YARHG domain-containing protein [Bradyrhizobium sediminis]